MQEVSGSIPLSSTSLRSRSERRPSRRSPKGESGPDFRELRLGKPTQLANEPGFLDRATPPRYATYAAAEVGWNINLIARIDALVERGRRANAPLPRFPGDDKSARGGRPESPIVYRELSTRLRWITLLVCVEASRDDL
jgi:hypothetical protein